MRITIVGCGNSGLIHAAKLSQDPNNEVCLLKSSHVHDDLFLAIQNRGYYHVVDNTNHAEEYDVYPQMITRDAKQAMDFADVVFVMTTTLQHESVAQNIGQFAHDGQIIVICPGYMGSLIFNKYIIIQFYKFVKK